MKNGKWRAVRMINGKRKTCLCATKAEAKKWEAEQTENLWEPKELIPTASVLEFLTAYMDSQKGKVCKLNFQEKQLAFKRALCVIKPETPVDQVTMAQAEQVMRYVARLVSGYAANKTRKDLSAAWTWGKRLYGLTVNPWRETQKMSANEKPRYVPPEADFWKVYDFCQDPVDKTMLLFFLHTGARRDEVFRLTWNDVDFERQQVRLGTRKTATGGMEYAWIPLTSELKDALILLKEQSQNILVFGNRCTNKKYVKRGKWIQRLCTRAGVNPFGFHAIRHLTATILAHSGMSLPSIQAILRHHNPTTTARYIQSLGVQSGELDAVFSSKKRGAKMVNFGPKLRRAE
ncbi:MAG: site-specific integrase [Desulfovibrio sp.]|nr:site-specific integrase [Desulfovibrio sp.]